MVVTKDYRIIETEQNSIIAQLSGTKHRIIRLFLSVFSRNQANTKLPDMEYFENDLFGS